MESYRCKPIRRFLVSNFAEHCPECQTGPDIERCTGLVVALRPCIEPVVHQHEVCLRQILKFNVRRMQYRHIRLIGQPQLQT